MTAIVPYRVPAGARGKFGLAVILLRTLALLPALHAQQPGQAVPSTSPLPSIPTYSFSFERDGLPVPTYIVVIARDGSGRYAGTEVTLPARASDPAPAPQPFGREFNVTPATAGKIAELAHGLHNFSVTCASKAKNIADTGRKRLTYLGPDGRGSCDYNYTENKNVQALTDIFQGVAETMDQGRRLDFLHRYDRLGLDDAIAFLAQEVSSGRALEIGIIAPSLHAIAEDEEVMQRVRARASSLLALTPADTASR
jgi:hypothetical protein